MSRRAILPTPATAPDLGRHRGAALRLPAGRMGGGATRVRVTDTCLNLVRLARAGRDRDGHGQWYHAAILDGAVADAASEESGP